MILIMRLKEDLFSIPCYEAQIKSRHFVSRNIRYRKRPVTIKDSPFSKGYLPEIYYLTSISNCERKHVQFALQ